MKSVAHPLLAVALPLCSLRLFRFGVRDEGQDGPFRVFGVFRGDLAVLPFVWREPRPDAF